MKIFTDRIVFSTKGSCEVVDITVDLAAVIKKSAVKNGVLNVFAPGATGAVTTIEYEPGIVSDFKNLLREIIPEGKDYKHNRTHSDVNAASHLRASLLGPSLSIPVNNGNMTLGKWQQVVFIDMDNRPRKREIIVKIIGE